MNLLFVILSLLFLFFYFCSSGSVAGVISSIPVFFVRFLTLKFNFLCEI